MATNTPRAIRAMEYLDRRYGTRTSVILVYFMIGKLTQKELPRYLMVEYDFDQTQAETVALEIKGKLINPIIERIEFLNIHPEKKFKLNDDKNYILEIFQSGLIEEIQSEPLMVMCVNRKIFITLAEDFELKKDIEDALYANNQIIGRQMILNGKKTLPAIGNWIMDFIQQYESDLPDIIELSRFVSDSPNARQLSPEEKELLLRVLVTYRNIKFFPESMPSDDNANDDWEIIPVERETEAKKEEVEPIAINPFKETEKPKTTAPNNPPKAKEEIDMPAKPKEPEHILDLRTEENKPLSAKMPDSRPKSPLDPKPKLETRNQAIPASPIKPLIPAKPMKPIQAPPPANLPSQPKPPTKPIQAANPAKSRNPRLDELKQMADMYPADSLERQAIEEELEKIAGQK